MGAALLLCMPAGASAFSSWSLLSIDTRPLQATHQTFTFATEQTLPSGGYLELDFGTGGFDPALVTIDDIDLAIGGIDQDLAATPSGATWGVSFSGAPRDTIRFTSGQSTPTGTFVIEIGNRASHQATGEDIIVNPALTGTYGVIIRAHQAAGSEIERAKALSVVVEGVSVTATDDTETPSGSSSSGGTTVSVPGVFAPEDPGDACFQIGDLDGNCIIDLHDFSIAGYWESRSLGGTYFFHLEALRLNGDGKIDLVDFSIMAYYYGR